MRNGGGGGSMVTVYMYSSTAYFFVCFAQKILMHFLYRHAKLTLFNCANSSMQVM